jgi:hypothetical protein
VAEPIDVTNNVLLGPSELSIHPYSATPKKTTKGIAAITKGKFSAPYADLNKTVEADLMNSYPANVNIAAAAIIRAIRYSDLNFIMRLFSLSLERET